MFALRCLSFSIMSMAAISAARAELTLSNLFSNEMVLQCEMPVDIWGQASPNTEVRVTLGEQSLPTTSDAEGNWRVTLEPLTASFDPLDLIIVSAAERKVFRRVVVGEVWLGVGGPNLHLYNRAKSQIVHEMQSRLIALGHVRVHRPFDSPRPDTPRLTGWTRPTSHEQANFSDSMYLFGLKVARERETPVGVVMLSHEEMPTVHWLPPGSSRHPEVVSQFEEYRESFPVLRKRWAAQFRNWELQRESYLERGERNPSLAPPPPPEPTFPTETGSHWKARIEPLIPYACRGVIWDQGDSGTGAPGVDQFTLVSAILREWRSRLDRKLFALIIQKPVGGSCPATTPTRKPLFESSNSLYLLASRPRRFQQELPLVNTGNGLLDQHYLLFEKLPDVSLVPTRDLDVGGRVVDREKLAQRMLVTAYNSVYKNERLILPQYASHEVDGEKVTVTFAGTRAGLSIWYTQEVQGFEVCGEVRRWQWAEGKIVGRDTVVVSARNVKKPVAVRYGWSYDRGWSNLFNSLKVPVQSFSTARWNVPLLQRELPSWQSVRLGQVEYREQYWSRYLGQEDQ